MSLIKFRKIILEQGQTIENWLGENNLDENTRYTFYNEDESEILGEYIGNKKVVKDVQVFSGDFNDLINKPTKLSDFDNDKDFATETYVDTEINTKLSSVMTYKGNVPTENDLPTEGNEIGDFYNVVDTGVNFAWDGTKWDQVGGLADLSSAVGEAPIDGKEYIRKDGSWEELFLPEGEQKVLIDTDDFLGLDIEELVQDIGNITDGENFNLSIELTYTEEGPLPGEAKLIDIPVKAITWENQWGWSLLFSNIGNDDGTYNNPTGYETEYGVYAVGLKIEESNGNKYIDLMILDENHEPVFQSDYLTIDRVTLERGELVREAPENGKIYARRDGSWEELSLRSMEKEFIARQLVLYYEENIVDELLSLEPEMEGQGYKYYNYRSQDMNEYRFLEIDLRDVEGQTLREILDYIGNASNFVIVWSADESKSVFEQELILPEQFFKDETNPLGMYLLEYFSNGKDGGINSWNSKYLIHPQLNIISFEAFKGAQLHLDGPLVLHPGVTNIGESAFEDFTGIESILAQGKIYIDKNAFKNSSIKNLILLDKYVNVGGNPFGDTTPQDVKIYVTDSVVDNFKDKYDWSDKVFSLNELPIELLLQLMVDTETRGYTLIA